MNDGQQAMRILAVDLSHVFRRNWEACDGKELGAAFERTISRIASVRDGFDRVAVCCDFIGGKSWRRIVDPEYKADRTDPGEAYKEQIRRTIKRLQADGCHLFVAPASAADPDGQPLYAEADDVIGSLARWYRECKFGVGSCLAILSDDSDLEQLVDDAESVYVLKSDGKECHGDTVRTNWGVAEPALVRDVKALAGDTSDHYRPFANPEKNADGKRKPGIGDKTAADLLRRFGTAQGVINALAKMDEDGAPLIADGAVRKLLEHGGQAALDRGIHLASLVTDLPMEFATLLSAAKVAPIAQAPKREAGPAPQVQASTAPTQHQASTAMVQASPAAMEKINPFALQPRGLAELYEIATALHNSRMYQLPNAEAIMAVGIEANERGKPLGSALRNAYVVKGKLSWSAAWLAGLVMSSGAVDYWELAEVTHERAVLKFKRRGRPEQTYTATKLDAERAGYLKSSEQWQKNTRTMLAWMVQREAARMFFPDIVGNMYTPDELRAGTALIEEIEGEIVG